MQHGFRSGSVSLAPGDMFALVTGRAEGLQIGGIVMAPVAIDVVNVEPTGLPAALTGIFAIPTIAQPTRGQVVRMLPLATQQLTA